MVLSQRSYRLFQRTDIVTYTGLANAAAIAAAIAAIVASNEAVTFKVL